MNIIQIAGHLGADAETRHTPGGAKVTSLRIATRSRKKGEDQTIWYRVSLWGDQFDNIMPYLTKGKVVIVSGEFMPPETYNDRNGQTQVSLEIRGSMVLFPSFGKKEGQEGAAAPMATAAAAAPAQPVASNDDDLPF
jgi:single-strand DNA-binding protein